jgi:hypothetical protein
MYLATDSSLLHTAGGDEERWNEINGLPPPPHYFKPKTSNIAPRTTGWTPSKTNTQTPPVYGKVRYHSNWWNWAVIVSTISVELNIPRS